jgi:lysine-specific histone demethylase 1
MSAYMFYSKAHFDDARKKCEEGRRPGRGKASANEVRVMSAKMWKELPAESRKPFEAKAEEKKIEYQTATAEFNERVAEWDKKANELRLAYEKENPPEELAAIATADESRGRRTKKVESYAEVDSEGEYIQLAK